MPSLGVPPSSKSMYSLSWKLSRYPCSRVFNRYQSPVLPLPEVEGGEWEVGIVLQVPTFLPLGLSSD